jgi:hypothetical protein
MIKTFDKKCINNGGSLSSTSQPPWMNMIVPVFFSGNRWLRPSTKSASTMVDHWVQPATIKRRMDHWVQPATIKRRIWSCTYKTGQPRCSPGPEGLRFIGTIISQRHVWEPTLFSEWQTHASTICVSLLIIYIATIMTLI